MAESGQSDRIPRTHAGKTTVNWNRRNPMIAAERLPRTDAGLAMFVNPPNTDEEAIAAILAIEVAACPNPAAHLSGSALLDAYQDCIEREEAAPPEPPLDVERLAGYLVDAENDDQMGPEYRPDRLARYIIEAITRDGLSASVGEEPA